MGKNWKKWVSASPRKQGKNSWKTGKMAPKWVNVGFGGHCSYFSANFWGGGGAETYFFPIFFLFRAGGSKWGLYQANRFANPKVVWWSLLYYQSSSLSTQTLCTPTSVKLPAQWGLMAVHKKKGNIPVTTTTKIFPEVLRYKWEAYCDTNGRRTEEFSLSWELSGTEKHCTSNWRRIAKQIGGVLQYHPHKKWLQIKIWRFVFRIRFRNGKANKFPQIFFRIRFRDDHVGHAQATTAGHAYEIN